MTARRSGGVGSNQYALRGGSSQDPLGRSAHRDFAAALALQIAPDSEVVTSLDDEVSAIRERWPDVKLDVHERDDKVIVLSRIVVPDRGQGTGTEIMEQIVAYADRGGATIGLTPTSDFGGTKSRLERFYRGFGFRPNKGSKRDLRIRESWIREPTAE